MMDCNFIAMAVLPAIFSFPWKKAWNVRNHIIMGGVIDSTTYSTFCPPSFPVTISMKSLSDIEIVQSPFLSISGTSSEDRIKSQV